MFFPVFLRRQVALRLRFPLRHRLIYFRTPASLASPATGSLAVDHFDLAATFLRSAGTTAVRTTGSLAGAPRVGGGRRDWR